MNSKSLSNLLLGLFLVMSSVPVWAAQLKVSCSGSSPVAIMYDATYPEDPFAYINQGSDHFDVLLNEDEKLYFGEWQHCENPGNWGCETAPIFQTVLNIRLHGGKILKASGHSEIEIAPGQATIRDHSCLLQLH